jgi:hypothetical protein
VHRCDEIEPELRIAHELQVRVRWRGVVAPLQRVQQALQIDLEPFCIRAAGRCRGNILHLDEILLMLRGPVESAG